MGPGVVLPGEGVSFLLTWQHQGRIQTGNWAGEAMGSPCWEGVHACAPRVDVEGGQSVLRIPVSSGTAQHPASSVQSPHLCPHLSQLPAPLPAGLHG